MVIDENPNWAGDDPHEPIKFKLAEAQAERLNTIVRTRAQAVENSVVNRSLDIARGTIARLPYDRVRSGVSIGPGWLRAPDPTHTRAWWSSWIVDDMFLYGAAFARVTSRTFDLFPNALQWMPFVQVVPNTDGTGVVWHQGDYPDPLWPIHLVEDVAVDVDDVVVFESPLMGLLNSGCEVLSTAARLDSSANRFASAEIPAGWLKQTGGEELSADEQVEQINRWQIMRRINSTGYVPEDLEYNESTLDPGRLQLVEGRAYQDAAVARVCNIPNYAAGVGVPNDSMTYKTSYTARLDLLDFGLAPIYDAVTQRLSADDVTPHGTDVVLDLEPFLRTAALAGLAKGGEQPAPAPGGPDA